MEIFLSTVIHIFVLWFVFKVGEHLAYFRIARGLAVLKQHVKETSEMTKGIAKIEKIGDQYYAYIDDTFVAQGESVDKVREAIKTAIEKEPSRYIGLLKEQGLEK
jgi:predicted RNase H-like HicB family nuclease